MFASTTAQNPPPYYNKPASVDPATGMHYMRLGNTGAVVSRICLGLMTYSDAEKPMFAWSVLHRLSVCGQSHRSASALSNTALTRCMFCLVLYCVPQHNRMMSAEQGEQFVKQALDAGITFMDTAEMYATADGSGSSERFFGAALKKLLPTSRYTRDDLFITTKIMPIRSLKPDGPPVQRGLSRKAIYSALEGSLARLQLDYVDLYLLHRYDANTAPEETMKALHDLVVAGKVRYIGASAMYAWQFARLNEAAERNGWTKLTVMQNHYNALYREDEREMIPYCVSGQAHTATHTIRSVVGRIS